MPKKQQDEMIGVTLQIPRSVLVEIIASVGGGAAGGKAKEMDQDEFEELCEKYREEFGNGKLKKLLKEFDYKSVGHVDPKSFLEIAEVLEEALGDLEEDEDEDDDGDNDTDEDDEEITTDHVKEIYQAARKANKRAAEKVLKEFDITARSIHKLEGEDIGAAYDEFFEIAGIEDED